MKNKIRNTVIGLALAIVCILTTSNVHAQAPTVGGDNVNSVGDAMKEGTKKAPEFSKALLEGGEEAFNVDTQILLLPLFSSPNWLPEARLIAGQWVTNRSAGTNAVTIRLSTRYISQETGAEGRSAWEGFRATRKTDLKLRIGKLNFLQWSSDSGNSLSNGVSLVGGTYQFSSTTIGIIWGPNGENGPRSEQQIIMSGDDRDVDEIVSIPFQGKYYTYGAGGYTAVDNWVTGQNLAVSFETQIIDNGVVVARGRKTLQAVGNPATPLLSISLMNGKPTISLVLEGNRTATLLKSSDLIHWMRDSTINAGTTVTRGDALYLNYRVVVD